VKPSLTSEQIRQLRRIQLDGGMSAAEASKAFSISPETVRRLWRGETHRADISTYASTAEESLARILAEANKPEESNDSTEID